MGISHILETQEYTHAYQMWEIILANKRTQVRFKNKFQEAYLGREELEQTEGAAGYGSANNVKHGEMDNAFMNFASVT